MSTPPPADTPKRTPIRVPFWLAETAIQYSIHGSEESQKTFQLYVQIGRCATRWSAFERLLDDTIWTLANADHQLGACVTNQLSSGYNRLIVIESLARVRGLDQKLLDRLSTIASKYHGMNDARNRMVHDPVAYEEAIHSMVVYTMSSRKSHGLNYDQIPVTHEQYQLAVDKIEAFIADFFKLRSEMIDSLPAWQ